MKFLAIDPGNKESAYCLYYPEEADVKDRLGYAGKIDNEAMLDICLKGSIGADLLVIEMIACMGMAVGATVFDTVFWSGRFVQAAQLPFELVYRREEKLHICGNPRAKDTNIRQALLDKFGEKGTKKNPGPLYHFKADMFAALAVAVTFAETRMKHENVLA